MFAQGIHAASDRAARPFIAVNCAALPAHLVESELFGYVGGAFSGARRDGASGKFEAANGGTILLDEVGDLSLPAQAALLRVLQEGEVTRVGATRGTPVDVRVIAATNSDVDAARRNGTFRDDLFYRLSVLSTTTLRSSLRSQLVRPLTLAWTHGTAQLALVLRFVEGRALGVLYARGEAEHGEAVGGIVVGVQQHGNELE
jgi:sigma-54 dependent transcriptional regulator, acetoin dehydrogenase operon transcriptional activator AcoR